jgi:hypothetical protein
VKCTGTVSLANARACGHRELLVDFALNLGLRYCRLRRLVRAHNDRCTLRVDMILVTEIAVDILRPIFSSYRLR